MILALKALGIKDMSSVDFIDKPDIKSTVAALQTLIRLGALDAETAALTETGRNMAVMPTDPTYSKLLVTACKPQYQQVADQVAAIVAMLSVENVFYQMTNLDSKNPKDKFKLKAIKKRKRFTSQHSDHLALLNVFTDFLKVSGR